MVEVVTIGAGFQVRGLGLNINFQGRQIVFTTWVLVQSSSFTNPFCQTIKLSLISLKRGTQHTHTHSLHIDNI